MARKKSATVDLKARMKEPLRRQIEKSAKASGISMNAEIVYRLEESYGRKDAEASAYGGERLAALFRMLGGAANIIESRTGKSLSEDVNTLFAIRAAWNRLIPGWLPTLPLPSEIIEARNVPEPGEAPTTPKMPEPDYPAGLLGEPKMDPEIWAAYKAEMKKFNQEREVWKAELTQRTQATNTVMEWLDEIENLGMEASAALLPPQETKNGE